MSETSKFVSCSASSRSRRSRSATERLRRHLAGADLEPLDEAAAGEVDDPLEGRNPHVQLDLLAHPQVVVEQVGEAVAAARPALDLEDDLPVLLEGPELDLARLEVARHRHEP